MLNIKLLEKTRGNNKFINKIETKKDYIEKKKIKTK